VTPKPIEGRPSLLQGTDEGRAVTPAAEWLIDNYHLIEKQIREIRPDPPAGYYRQWPKLSTGAFAGYPRVFGMAWAFVARTDSRFDSKMLVGYPHRCKVEPYVVAADVYANAPHVGRGGWTWRTGSAAWMQRAGVESILGVRREGDFPCVDPCIPKSWTGLDVALRHGASRYDIRVENPEGVARGVVSVSIDGEDIHVRPPGLPPVDDGATRRVVIQRGAGAS
jgi:hypothetical protein